MLKCTALVDDEQHWQAASAGLLGWSNIWLLGIKCKGNYLLPLKVRI